jgi:hypothetical protein
MRAAHYLISGSESTRASRSLRRVILNLISADGLYRWLVVNRSILPSKDSYIIIKNNGCGAVGWWYRRRVARMQRGTIWGGLLECCNFIQRR